MQAATGGGTLQQRIDVLTQLHGDDSETLRTEVSKLVQQEGLAVPYGSSPGTPGPSNQQGPSGSSTPLASSRSSRNSKPLKPFSTPLQQPRGTPQPSYSQRTSSSLNPNRAAPPPPTRVPLSTNAIPVPPLTGITDARYQAMYTTYPSRMRLGTSSLMQPHALPNPSKAPVVEAPPPVIGKRSRAAVNYAELEGTAPVVIEEEDTGGMMPKKALNVSISLPPTPAEPAPKQVWGDGKSYLGVLPPGNMVTVQPAVKTKHQVLSDAQLDAQASRKDHLVPIQVDLDVDSFKIRDAFVWNANEREITADTFARIFCDDLDLPHTFAEEIATQIKTQVSEQAGVAEVPVRSAEDEERHVEKDLRVVLNLDVQIGTLHLVDRIEWDLSSPLTPEHFASVLVRDLGLPTSGGPLISHAVHEELMRTKRTCLTMGLLGADDATLKRRGAKPLEGAWREWNETANYGPRVHLLSLDEMDKVEAERERAARRAKRDKLSGSRTGGRRR